MYADVHGVSNLLDPRYVGSIIDENNRQQIINFISHDYPYACDKLATRPSSTAYGELIKWLNNATDTKDNYPARLQSIKSGEVSLYAYWESVNPLAYPHIREIALMAFSIPCSASASERNWSSSGFIHCKALQSQLQQTYR